MLYQPINVEYPGMTNTAYGVGVLTSLGAYLTSKLPPFTRIYMTAYLPTKTLFIRSNGDQEEYKIPSNMALGTKEFIVLKHKPTKHLEKARLVLTKTVNINAIIRVEESSPGNFVVTVIDNNSGVMYQPFNGWATAFS